MKEEYQLSLYSWQALVDLAATLFTSGFSFDFEKAYTPGMTWSSPLLCKQYK
jgi:hypothetical protein